MKVNIKKLRGHAIIPVRNSSGAAGCDLYAAFPHDNGEDSVKKTIAPGHSLMVPTGISMEIPAGYSVEIYPRSGLSVKKGLRLCNCVGLIDYRGEFFVPLYNDSEEVQEIEDGNRIAQIVFRKYYVPDFVESESLSETERNSGGFGSTGV